MLSALSPKFTGFVQMEAQHMLALKRQPSQLMALGMEGEISLEAAEFYAAQPVAWAFFGDGELLACLGFVEPFPGRQGLGWALLAAGIGRHHMRLTRFVQQLVAECTLPRLEVLTRCVDVEPMAAQSRPWHMREDLLQLALSQPTPEVRWAQLLGLEPVHVLRRYGPQSESYLLFERIR